MNKRLSTKGRRFWGFDWFNLFVWVLLAFYLLPVAFMIVTAFMSTDQLRDTTQNSPLLPAKIRHYIYNGQVLVVYNVPTTTGVQQLALVTPGQTSSKFVDPASNGGLGEMTWQGDWKTLTPVYDVFALTLDNFQTRIQGVDFPRMFSVSLFMAVVTEIAVLISSVVVAYGFTRFSLPGGNLLFYILIATILIPEKITYIPTYFFYATVLHWDGTLYPLIVPFIFGNAIYIFLLRQNFRGLPYDLEEAAMLDGAGPLRRLYSVILPQSWAVILTVSILHFFYIWNETRQASIYVATTPSLMPISFGMQNYIGLAPNQGAIEAYTLVAIALPVFLLFLTQRLFLQGIIITGGEKKE